MDINGEWVVIGYTAKTSLESVERETSKIEDEAIKNDILKGFELCFQQGLMVATFETKLALSEKSKSLFKDSIFDGEWINLEKQELGRFREQIENKYTAIMKNLGDLGNDRQKEVIEKYLRICYNEGCRMGRRQYA